MASFEKVIYVDDLDQTEGDDIETISFSLDGVSYEIDLKPANAAKLREVLAPYAEVARQTGSSNIRALRPTRARRAVTRTQSETKPDPKAIRAWAQARGIDVPKRGRIPQSVVTQFTDAGN